MDTKVLIGLCGLFITGFVAVAIIVATRQKPIASEPTYTTSSNQLPSLASGNAAPVYGEALPQAQLFTPAAVHGEALPQAQLATSAALYENEETWELVRGPDRLLEKIVVHRKVWQNG